MKTILLIFLCSLIASGQVKPLKKESTKQETMDWIASKFQYNYFSKPFPYKGDILTYSFVSYKNNAITFRKHIDWKSGFEPEMKFYYYTLYLNNIEKVQFSEKTGSLKLLGKNIQQMVLDDKTAYFFNYFDVNLPIKKGEQVPILYEASPWLLKSLAGAFTSLVKSSH